MGPGCALFQQIAAAAGLGVDAPRAGEEQQSQPDDPDDVIASAATGTPTFACPGVESPLRPHLAPAPGGEAAVEMSVPCGGGASAAAAQPQPQAPVPGGEGAAAECLRGLRILARLPPPPPLLSLAPPLPRLHIPPCSHRRPAPVDQPPPQLAEDNVTNQKIVCRILLKVVDAPVAVAANGLEAVQAVKEGRFDVVLMDVQARAGPAAALCPGRRAHRSCGADEACSRFR